MKLIFIKLTEPKAVYLLALPRLYRIMLTASSIFILMMCIRKTNICILHTNCRPSMKIYVFPID